MVCKNKKTTIINLYSGPGTGKSTTSGDIWVALKRLNIDSELVREVAKDYVWEERQVEFSNQLCILGKQIKKVNSVIGKVDVIVLDSPLLLSAQYNNVYNKELFYKLCLDTYNMYDNLDIYLNRVKDYNPNGRFQTEEEANKVSKEVKQLLDNLNINYTSLEADKEVTGKILKLLAEKRPSLFIDLNKYDSVFDARYDMDKIIGELK